MAFIKIDREILSSYCFANPNHLKVWIWLLVKANFKKTFASLKIGKGCITVKVERGQLIFGRFKAEEELGLDGSMIYRILQKFEEQEQIKIEANNQYSIITICKYDVYQNNKSEIEQPTNNQSATYEQPTDSQRTADELDTNTSKEGKEGKEGKEIKEDISTDVKKNKYPTIIEVESYFLEKGSNKIESEKFFYFYESKGWKVGKSPMVKWKSAASGWISRNKPNNTKQFLTNNKKDNREYWEIHYGHLGKTKEEIMEMVANGQLD